MNPKELLRHWPIQIPFERAVRRNLTAVKKLNDAGWTWRQIAAVLTGLGARHANGQPINGKQLNTVVLRVACEARKNTASPIDMQQPTSTHNIMPGKRVKNANPVMQVPRNPTEPSTLSERLAEAIRMRQTPKTFDE
ncbi:MAG: hypothetical protein HYX63_21845 [Gammaproteobacteria bacterium]|nr:hypothetical protein [Gammaproteobacteria bacterium]